MRVKPKPLQSLPNSLRTNSETKGLAALIGTNQLRHLAPRGKRLRGGMSQEHASGALARRSGVGTTIAYSALGGFESLGLVTREYEKGHGQIIHAFRICVQTAGSSSSVLDRKRQLLISALGLLLHDGQLRQDQRSGRLPILSDRF